MPRSNLKTQGLLLGIFRKVSKEILLKLSMGNFKVSMGKMLTFPHRDGEIFRYFGF